MADIKIPDEIAQWMTDRNWGGHHDQWHWERRWDYWNALLVHPDVPNDWKQWIQSKFDEASVKGWSRAASQEGETGNGEEFLFMHRAMIELIIDEFPQHLHFFRGWYTPPTDFESELDPVPVPTPEPDDVCNPVRKEICPPMLAAINRIENNFGSFTDDDDFGRFVETNLRPVAGNPLARSSDLETGIHNYLHGRWSGMSADLDLGDPRFNIFNTRFWRLHGWIDHQWWKFRAAKGLSNNDSRYIETIETHKNMMDMKLHHHGEHLSLDSPDELPSKNAFIDLLASIKLVKVRR